MQSKCKLEQVYDTLLDQYHIGRDGEMVEQFSDKGTRHSYLPVYQQWFDQYQPAPRILEIGIMTGASLLLWSQWFEQPEIWAMDIRPGFNQPRPWHQDLDQSHIHCAWRQNSTCDNAWPGQQWDIVIDDGSHRVADQIATFNNLWPTVAPGGIYVIEDIVDADAMLQLHNHVDIATFGQQVQVLEHRGLRAGRADDQLLGIQLL